jgi:hypothetical protein
MSDAAISQPRSWRSLAEPIVVALVVLVLADWVVGGSGGIHLISGPATSGPLAGWIVMAMREPGGGALTFVAWFILGASVILAVAYAVRVWAPRLDLIIFVVWTLAFVWVTSNRNVALSDYVCLPGYPGQSIPPSLGTCYQPWVPGFPRMAVWLLVSAAILGVGYLFRRRRSTSTRPVDA